METEVCFLLNTLEKLKGYHHEVCYKKHAIANILSKKWVSIQYRVSMDTGKDGAIWVRRSEKSGLPDIEFKMHESGLRYWDPTKSGSSMETKNLAFVETVEDKRKYALKEKSRWLR
jgi:hypothetical protein